MKTHLTALAILAALLSITPSCSNDEEGSGDGDSSASGDGDRDGDGDSSGELTVLDTDDDGVPDGIDTNGDGEPDISGTAIDVDDDGTWDGLDTNGNGSIDVYLPGGSVTGPGGDGDGDGDGDSGGLADEFEACAAEAREAEALPADIFFMIDQSISMVDHTVPDNDPDAPTRWDVLRDAVLEFVEDDESAGLRVGLQFFPQPGMAPLPDDMGNSGVSCDTADYAQAEVEIGELPGNAGALSGAYPETPAGGFTPSYHALEGALTHARDWAGQAENAGRGVAVVWVTDGFPTVCEDRTISGLSALAEEYANPEGDEIRVPTFVVGLGPTANLSVVARSGGTGDGYFVADEEGAVDDLLASLRRVANSPALCEFDFPEAADGSLLDPNKVNVQFTPRGGSPESVGQTDGPSSCGATGGWYYDNPDDPQTIHVCPQSCGNFGGGTVSIVVGCEVITLF